LILKLALSGKLVAQNQSDEHASELLRRIKLDKESPRLNISETEPPYQLPEGWIWCSLVEIIELRSGDTIDKVLEKDSGEIPYVKVGDMNLPDNENVITTSSRFVDRSPKVINSIIPPFSIIFPKRGGAIATNKKRIVQREIIVDLNTMALIIPELIFEYTRVWFDSIDLWKLNNGTSVPQINNKDIYPLLIPLPPLAEQKRIVDKVEELMAVCDKLEVEQFKNLKTHQALVKTLLETLTQAVDATELQAPWERISAHFDILFCTEDSVDQLKQAILQLAVMGKLVKQDPNE
jgi:type I restriction enzyme, S subunit